MPRFSLCLYHATKQKAKRQKNNKFEAMPETQALRAELGALQRGIAGEQVYMGSADYESALRERVELAVALAVLGCQSRVVY